MARTTPQDVLVASATPGVREALAAGHELYAAEMDVASCSERYENAPTRLRERCRQRLADAAQRRYALDAAYADALLRVKATDEAVAEHVEDAVWRGYLIGEGEAL